MGTPRKWKKAGVKSEGHLGKKMKGAEKILGHWRIAESEPYKTSEEDEE